MCGLYVSITASPVSQEAVEKKMEIRGGDDFGFFERTLKGGRYLSVAHSRLEINTVGSIEQPRISERLLVVFNGEIYNYQQLAPCASEIEAIEYLYNKEGPTGLRKLRGMYAIVIVDLIKLSLTVVRDFTGQKPLFVCRGKDAFVIASDYDYSDHFSADYADPIYAVMFEANTGIPIPDCMRGVIRSIECNTIMEFDFAGKILRQASLLDIDEKISSLTPTTDRLAELVIRAVSKTLPSDQEFAIFLSGGIDSRALLACCKHLGHMPSIAFTVDGSEASDAGRVAEFFGIPLCVVNPRDEKYHLWVKRYLSGPHYKSQDMAAIGLIIMAVEARRRSIKVCLVGDGGDEAFLGYPFFFRPQVNSDVTICKKQSTYGDRLMRTIVGMHFTSIERVSGLFGKQLNSTILNSETMYRWAMNYKSLQRFYLFYVLPNVLNRKTDTAGYVGGVEIRSPFLDEELLLNCISYAEAGKIKNFDKDVFRGIIESSGCDLGYRSKTGFNLPFSHKLHATTLIKVLNFLIRGQNTLFKIRLLLNRKSRYAILTYFS